MSPQPQLLPPNVIEHWYAGGPALAAWRGLAPVGERSPEEWIGATVARFGERRPRARPPGRRHPTARRRSRRPGRLARPRRRRAGGHRRAGETARRGSTAARPRASHPRLRHPPPRLRLRQDRGVVRAGGRAGRRGLGRAGARTSTSTAFANSSTDQDAEAMLALMHRIPVRPRRRRPGPRRHPARDRRGHPADRGSGADRSVDPVGAHQHRRIGRGGLPRLDRDTALSVVDTAALADPGSADPARVRRARRTGGRAARRGRPLLPDGPADRGRRRTGRIRGRRGAGGPRGPHLRRTAHRSTSRPGRRSSSPPPPGAGTSTATPGCSSADLAPRGHHDWTREGNS